jgi:ceramide glucosyltransferase
MEDCSFTIFALVAMAREAIVIALWAGGIAGLGYLGTAVFAAWRFGRRVGPPPSVRPPVTILKPLCGDEPELYENLRSFSVQAYPSVQVVFGLRDADDPARAVVERLIADLPGADLVLVVDDRLHGTNYKISNVINMMAAARHDLLVLADSDMRVAPDYLDQIVAPLADPGVGLVTCLYVGEPARPGLWSNLGTLFINHGFLPAVLVGQLTGGRQDCFGASAALRRSVLERFGGFAALRNRLADDHALGQAVRGLGLRVALAHHLVTDRVAEAGPTKLLRRELRWARTIRSITPFGFAGSAIITHPLPLALLAATLEGFSAPAVAALASVLVCRLVATRLVDRALASPLLPLELVPVRDVLSFAVLIASLWSSRVEWRGRWYRILADGNLSPDRSERHDDEDTLSPPTFVRGFRRRRGVALSGAARDSLVLVSDLAGAAGGAGGGEQARRRAAEPSQAQGRAAARQGS